MSLKKIVAVIISLLLLIPISKNWISLFISTYEEYKANENKDEETVTIADEVKEEEEDSIVISDKMTDAETQEPVSKKNQESVKSGNSDIVDINDTPLKYIFLSDHNIAICSDASITGETAYLNLTSITIPAKIRINGEVYTVTKINTDAFHNCINLMEIEIPSTITDINVNTFCDKNLEKLTNITVAPDNPSYSSEGGVLYNKNKTKILRVPIGIKGNFEIPKSVTTIGDLAFCFCTGLTNIKIPSKVTAIGYYAFSGCSNLTDITIPKSVAGIGNFAFLGCKNLNVIVDNSKKNVEYNTSTFQGCKSLIWAK